MSESSSVQIHLSSEPILLTTIPSCLGWQQKYLFQWKQMEDFTVRYQANDIWFHIMSTSAMKMEYQNSVHDKILNEPARKKGVPFTEQKHKREQREHRAGWFYIVHWKQTTNMCVVRWPLMAPQLNSCLLHWPRKEFGQSPYSIVSFREVQLVFFSRCPQGLAQWLVHNRHWINVCWRQECSVQSMEAVSYTHLTLPTTT